MRLLTLTTTLWAAEFTTYNIWFEGFLCISKDLRSATFGLLRIMWLVYCSGERWQLYALWAEAGDRVWSMGGKPIHWTVGFEIVPFYGDLTTLIVFVLDLICIKMMKDECCS